jgi:hypothetical protein
MILPYTSLCSITLEFVPRIYFFFNPNPRILIIFDDLVGSSLFAGTRGSYFKGRGCIVL